ncbi:hypothetical protein JW935_23475 [candidate division KSB1 bacterium]|nr:hypothetical protein [candidate division KSB1 bacterium]
MKKKGKTSGITRFRDYFRTDVIFLSGSGYPFAAAFGFFHSCKTLTRRCKRMILRRLRKLSRMLTNGSLFSRKAIPPRPQVPTPAKACGMILLR